MVVFEEVEATLLEVLGVVVNLVDDVLLEIELFLTLEDLRFVFTVMVVLTLDFLDIVVGVVMDREIDRDIDRNGVEVIFALDLTLVVEGDRRRDVLLLAETAFKVGLVEVLLVDVVNLLDEVEFLLLVAAALTKDCRDEVLRTTIDVLLEESLDIVLEGLRGLFAVVRRVEVAATSLNTPGPTTSLSTCSEEATTKTSDPVT